MRDKRSFIQSYWKKYHVTILFLILKCRYLNQSISHMLSICDNYALKHDITFNPAKSKCMIFYKCIKTCTPYSVFFKGQLLNFINRCKLLGVSLSRNMIDIYNKQFTHSTKKATKWCWICYAFEWCKIVIIFNIMFGCLWFKYLEIFHCLEKGC